MLDQILQELYVGKTPELLEVEKLIGRIRSSYTDATFFTNPTYNKDMEKINRIFEDFFGFEVFSLMIDRSTAKNAYTMAISNAIDIAPQYRVKENLLATSKGFKYKKEAGYCCVVHMYNNLFFDNKFTDSEILAIILHEIGHNFQTVINQTLYTTTDAVNILNFIKSLTIYIATSDGDMASILGSILGLSLAQIITSNAFVKMYDKFLREINKDPNLRIVFGIASIYMDAMKELNFNINYIRTEVLKYGRIPQILVNSMLRKISRPFGAISENTADSFATIYGYGAEISSAMLKFSSNAMGPITQKALYDIPVLSQLIALYDLPIDIMVTVFDEHPSGIERAKLAKANLQKELKYAYLDPKMKAQIQKQINDIDKAVSQYEDMSKRIDNPKAYRALVDIFLYNLKGGESRSAKKSKAIMGDIDDIFDSAKLK